MLLIGLSKAYEILYLACTDVYSLCVLEMLKAYIKPESVCVLVESMWHQLGYAIFFDSPKKIRF